jgi:flavin-dependent dehydrogenase
VTDTRTEVIIVGGGPGGATLASLLRQRGRDVLVLERDAFPRFHIGESLLPASLTVLEEIGVLGEIDARFLRKYGAVFIDGERDTETRFSFAEALKTAHDHAYEVARDEFDQVLLDHARKLGAEVRHGWDVTRMLLDEGRACGVVARSPEGELRELRADVVVDATGRDALRAHAKRDLQKLPRLEETMAIFSQYRGVPRAPGALGGDIRIVLTPRCWFWLIPFKDGRTSVGATLHASEIVRARGRPSVASTFDSLRDAYPPVRRLLADAEPVFPPRAIADYSYRVPEMSGDGWLAVGDAGGFVDPLFSTGLHLAMRGARAAAIAIERALAAGDTSRARWIEYERAQRRATEIFMGAVQSYYRGELASLLLLDRDLHKPFMRRIITSILSGDVYYDEEPRWLREFARRFPAEMPASAQP